MTHRLTKQRDESAARRAREMHDECMKDPEYRKMWEELTAALRNVLCDLPDDVIS